MIYIKNDEEIKIMEQAGRILFETLEFVKKHVKPGITTKKIDSIAEEFILQNNAKPSFKGYMGFPSTLCTSINNEVIHGIPSSKILKEGDIIGIDCGVNINGFHCDAARTISVGNVSNEALNLIKVTEECFFKGIEGIKVGDRIDKISKGIQDHAESNNYSIVRVFTGHGVGKKIHEEPEVPNYVTNQRGARIVSGMTLAIEPMVNLGKCHVNVLEDGWTVVTVDGMLSAHYENTVAITDDGLKILTIGS